MYVVNFKQFSGTHSPKKKTKKHKRSKHTTKKPKTNKEKNGKKVDIKMLVSWLSFCGEEEKHTHKQGEKCGREIQYQWPVTCYRVTVDHNRENIWIQSIRIRLNAYAKHNI